MRSLLSAVAGLLLLASGAAQAKVAITVDKDAQMMTVDVDGVERYHWPVSTGIPSRETPSGSFRAFRMEEDHYSKEFDDAPMPHSIFFTKVGHAIHGTESEAKLGTPASHGCVRLSRANASTLYALVEEQGVLNTTVTLTGSAQVALARNPRGRSAITRREPARQGDPMYDNAAAGDPVLLNPPSVAAPRLYARPVPPPRPDDGYIYPADGSPDVARYPAPRGSRRIYDAQGYPVQPGYPVQSYQPYYDNRGYAPTYPPRSYY